MDIAEFYLIRMADAAYESIQEDLARAAPGEYPEVDERIRKREEERERLREAHKKVCNCEFCGYDEF